MKKLYATFTASLFLAGIAQAALLTDIDGAAASVDYTGEDFSGQTVGTELAPNSTDNWGRSDIFTNADFSSAEFNLSGNQSFLGTTITGADFTGATFNITTWLSGTTQRFNTFRNATGSGASFEDTAWNITLSSTDAFDNSEFFDGTGTLSAMDFSGATFTFDITDSDVATQTAAVDVIIGNLGDSASYFDDDFVTNNFVAFGYASGALLEADLVSNGWQVIPEPGSYALLAGLLGMSYVMVRRRRA
ncbi:MULTISPECIES: PEP-CTERM sorting domain-containing protein [unclassified Lentimonas]|uniref:PEP-CTERM sorting domain-containing protein n=1 Tax=unclassified Lentimonas TaxID=2630993 RepID=UPI001323DAFF|nr:MULTISPECIES: PEP-CTERM sorting domain-containing protein [unclassified Lentimonas]CAA6691322.1 Unannotated [Lentimonas sp. CC10]CAA6695945.1 Unannotated [Lentimonas sp. CC19]CAA7068684.1 Unannotated [Lentimonas sp. CC11]